MATFGTLDFAVSFNPLTAFPLDARSVFTSLDDATTAAAGAVEVGSSEGTYYIGQPVVVITADSATEYVIQPDKTLKATGVEYTLPQATTTVLGGVKVDGSTIQAVDGTISVVKTANALTVGEKTFDGSAAVEITASDVDAYTKTEVDDKFAWVEV